MIKIQSRQLKVDISVDTKMDIVVIKCTIKKVNISGQYKGTIKLGKGINK